ncbi:hypothetical protein MBEHAL_1384 [Halarchaeum acidiphilum MH1-52-1]|uniref:Gins51 C-terminal domain-containing protein n=1 Tax=Halarchaeum acidiphilum MH1-52-1 TaxID=1261545 RepID=U3A4Q3_9EURY|nr:hypothetical protein [Halarchaeum acidiphilum]GAD52624.1 hypothetical protein MBEHAL_1384 [Halarchaeum acidiphilum MH1-52-1]
MGGDDAAALGGDGASDARGAERGDGDTDGETDDGESAADDRATSAERGDASDTGGREIERATVRITQDVGEVLGVDERAYTLESDDVVTLPRENAEPLLARDAAEELD